MAETLTLLHTADLHLGASFAGLGERGRDQRRRLREVLAEIAELSVRERAAVVLLAGDIFDNNLPSRDSLEAVDRFLERLHTAGLTAVAVAGTHDHLGRGAVWPAVADRHPEGLALLTPDRPEWIDARLGLRIQGVSLTAADDPARPVTLLRRAGEFPWQIGMTHAAWDLQRGNCREAVFTPDDIAATNLDYLALGHWHRRRECSAGKTVAWYPGSPEMIAMDEEDPGEILLVTLTPGEPARVEPRRTGRRSRLRLRVDAGRPDALLAEAKRQADPELMLELTIDGLFPPGEVCDPEQLRRELQDLYFHVRVRCAATQRVGEEALKTYPEQTLLGRYIRLLQQQMEKTDDVGERERLGEALQLGLAWLTGREIAPWS